MLLREVRDPRLHLVTVTAVQVTADLKIARVFFRHLGNEDPRDLQKALRNATPFLRGALGRGLGLRVTPELRFEYDSLPDTARRVDALLDAARHDDEDDEEPES